MTTVSAMSSPDATTVATGESLPAELVVVGSYANYTSGAEHGLVVLAMGRPYWLVPDGDQFSLMIEPSGDGDVREQLARFDRESVGWPPAPLGAGEVRTVDLFTPLLWAMLVVGIFSAQQRHPHLVENGALSTTALFAGGEWWRLGTALFLHGDAGHLVSNTVSGFLVFAAALSAFGTARGWLLLLLAAVIGNFASAAFNGTEPYSSIGASTAIFGGLGLLTGRAIRVARNSIHPHRLRGMLVPLGAGLCVLALYGAGGQRVDLGAHLCGFAAGLGIGLVTAPAPRAKLKHHAVA